MPAAYELEVAEELNIPEIPEEADSISPGEIVKTWVKTALTTVALFFFIVTFIIQGYSVYGSCMEPNLRTGERVLGSKVIYKFKQPSRGDVVVFEYPKDPSKVFIKRVIGLPGDVVEIQSGRVYINGKKLTEPYVINTPHGSYGPEHVQPGKLFVMGDYRDMSNDSRYWGELPLKNVQAKGWIRYWPINKMELIK